jgi:hypothetical protein
MISLHTNHQCTHTLAKLAQSIRGPLQCMACLLLLLLGIPVQVEIGTDKKVPATVCPELATP